MVIKCITLVPFISSTDEGVRNVTCGLGTLYAEGGLVDSTLARHATARKGNVMTP